MENINNEIKLLEEKVTSLSDHIEELTVLIHKLVAGLDQSDEVIESTDKKLEEVEKTIEEVNTQNEAKIQTFMSYTVTLMDQRRKAEDVDDKYFECEKNMKACKEIEKMVNTSKEMIEKQKLLLQMWKQL